MSLTKTISRKEDPLSANNKITLSRYFPKGTQYFYAYPAEEASHFYNAVPPEVEEVVAARPLSCCGPNVKVICFAESLKQKSWEMLNDLNAINIERKNILTLPEKITTAIKGNERNDLICESLSKMVKKGKLLMAQPFLDARLKSFYQIPPQRTIWLNDKRNLSSFIPQQFLPRRYFEFLDGMCFHETEEKVPLPCVVKVSSSSSGDGVRICRTKKDLEEAKHEFRKIEGMIIVDEYINIKKNLGVQFGIPYDLKKPIEIIGIHEQLTSKDGAFLGGILDLEEEKFYRKKLSTLLIKKILPEVQRKGWYGIGGFDVLVDKKGKFHFVDANFRMTGMTTYDFLVRNKIIKKSLISFSGLFHGNESEFREKIMKIATPKNKDQMLFITALTEKNNMYRFNAAMIFDNKRQMKVNAKKLIESGVISEVMSQVCEGKI
ncbi:MAG: hypothetical protein AAB551_02040 [Patescibacteria group bacterium]